MDRLLGLILAALLFGAASSHAAGTVPLQGTIYRIADPTLGTFQDSTGQGVCNQKAAAFNSRFGAGLVSTFDGVNRCTEVWQAYVGSQLITIITGSCPSNSTPSGGACTCNSGFNATGGACVGVLVPELGQVVSMNSSTKYTHSNGRACFDGVLAQATMSYGSEYAVGPWYSLGMSCDPNAAANGGDPYAPPPTAPSCPIGQCPGTVNGNSICVTCSSVTTSSLTTNQNSSGATTGGTHTSTTVNSDGTTQTTTTTYTGGGGGSGTSVTSPTNSGSTTTSGTVNTSTQSFCQQNPTASICAAQQSLCQSNPNIPACKYNTASGGCGTFTCDGDPAICAIARAAHDQRCQLVDGTGLDGSAKALYDQAKAAPAGPAASGTVSMSFPSIISQSDLLGGSCPTDTTFSIAGSSMSIPFSQLCGPLQMLGSLMVGLSMLAAAFIVFRN